MKKQKSKYILPNYKSPLHGIPRPFRCLNCPYPKVGFLCSGKDGSCLRTDVDEIMHKQKYGRG